MCESRQPTESDRLLPSPLSERISYKPTTNNDGQALKRQRYIIAGASLLTLVFSVHSILPASQYHQGNRYKPKEQLSTLQQLTENALLMSALPSSHQSHHPKGKVNVVKDEKHNHHHDKNNNSNNEDYMFHCTSQVMIMRHCDKKRVKYFHHGKEKTIASDTKDKDGDRHCSAKGIDRSNYIATLFVDPENYQELVEGSTSHHHHKHDEHSALQDGIPPVPFIKSNGFEGKVASASSKIKPQFPTPLKLYALSDERGPASKPSRHRNYREIETITPLSNKFHLDVDTRFGVKEEGELASDFFGSLSKSVQQNVKKMRKKKFGYTNAAKEEEDDEDGSSNDILSTHLCNSGMTVVNWKHSQIPILARALGCGKNEGCPKRYKGRDFDTMWLLTFQYSLLLDDDEDGDEQIDTSVSVESLSKASFLLQEEEGSLRLGKKKSKKHHHGDGRWKITAELVNEGFEPLKES